MCHRVASRDGLSSVTNDVPYSRRMRAGGLCKRANTLDFVDKWTQVGYPSSLYGIATTRMDVARRHSGTLGIRRRSPYCGGELRSQPFSRRRFAVGSRGTNAVSRQAEDAKSTDILTTALTSNMLFKGLM
jgi:hypothetical protein